RGRRGRRLPGRGRAPHGVAGVTSGLGKLDHRAALHRSALDPLGIARTADEAGGRTALVEGDRQVTYAELDALVAARAGDLGHGPGVEPVVAARTVDGVVALLGAWRAGRAVLMLPADGAEQRDRLLEAWPPGEYAVHRELALLLSTSGTTGSA